MMKNLFFLIHENLLCNSCHAITCTTYMLVEVYNMEMHSCSITGVKTTGLNWIDLNFTIWNCFESVSFVSEFPCNISYCSFFFLAVRYDLINCDNVANICSKSCAEADWELSHCLLCTGESSGSLCREALLKFIQHANGKVLNL